MNKFKFIIFFILITLNNNILKAQIEIKYKVGDEIITNIDIVNEKNYLIFLRPNLKELSSNEIIEISQNSLINEVIKKKEINKLFKNINNEILIKEVKKKLFDFKNVKNEAEFLNLLANTNINYNKIVEKMKYEALWNELIFRKYNSLIKIDEAQLKKELIIKISNNKKYEYNISELLFDIEKNDNLKNKYKKILNYIKLNDFKTAASRFSIANSGKTGGEIGWIKETLLSKKLISILSKVNKGEVTKPIEYPSGYLLIRINDKREMKQIISLDKELQDLINYEKNRQLSQFSLLFYKKLKQSSIINEY
tara:strand:- start:959 stop:1885 length:927 start_codon:yes stop_codon:yes gene_type:complete